MGVHFVHNTAFICDIPLLFFRSHLFFLIAYGKNFPKAYARIQIGQPWYFHINTVIFGTNCFLILFLHPSLFFIYCRHEDKNTKIKAEDKALTKCPN